MTDTAQERLSESDVDGRQSSLNQVGVVERIAVTGVVQGVGFRPFVFRLANELGVDGWVGNDSTGVVIVASGSASVLDRFVHRVDDEAPPLAEVCAVQRSDFAGHIEAGFFIADSQVVTGPPTFVPPDTAICDDCRRELDNPNDRRFGHPFITCTNCGPRFTIIESLPYDRPNTTMSGFEMCPACLDEYEDPTDRRFHAQPISCHDCGPRLSFQTIGSGENPDATVTSDPIGRAIDALRAGSVIAVKGMGGYHLACSAINPAAVDRIRRQKHRPDKPMAVMVGGLDEAHAFAHIDDAEAELLVSPARPIVLVEARPDSGLAPLVAPGDPLVGIMLPSTPLHHLLLADFDGPLVMTSANRSGEPMVYRTDTDLADLADFVLDHDRPIHTPCDDSVMRSIAGHPAPLRRARGYAPLPAHLGSGIRDVLAVGAELKNTFCVASGSRGWVSPHIGDMANLPTLEAFAKMVQHFCEMYNIRPDVVVADAHPGYVSSRWAKDRFGDRTLAVQHHHAHLASLMAEHQLDPHTPLFSFVFDGTGYGTDGSIWGGEVLSGDVDGFKRRAHLAPVSLPGGDAAIRHPSRVALAHLDAAGIAWSDDVRPLASFNDHELGMLQAQLSSGLGCVPTTSMGRLFDAVASLIGLRHQISFEAQAAIELEIAATRFRDQTTRPGQLVGYRFEVEGPRIETASVLESLLDDIRSGVEADAMAWRFHDAVAEVIGRLAAEQSNPNKVRTV